MTLALGQDVNFANVEDILHPSIHFIYYLGETRLIAIHWGGGGGSMLISTRYPRPRGKIDADDDDKLPQNGMKNRKNLCLIIINYQHKIPGEWLGGNKRGQEEKEDNLWISNWALMGLALEKWSTGQH